MAGVCWDAGSRAASMTSSTRCAAFDEAQRGLCALLHDLAELTGQDQLPISRDPGRFDKENVATDRRPGEPRGNAGNARAHRYLALKARRSQDFRQILWFDP